MKLRTYRYDGLQRPGFVHVAGPYLLTTETYSPEKGVFTYHLSIHILSCMDANGGSPSFLISPAFDTEEEAIAFDVKPVAWIDDK